MTITQPQISGYDEYLETLINAEVSNYVGVNTIKYDVAEKWRDLIPTVSGIESSQYFLDKVVDRHCISGVYWLKACGPGTDIYTPNITSPFELMGSPTNDLDFWRRYKENIINIGTQIGKDFSISPWNNAANRVAWSGNNYECLYPHNSSGTHNVPSGMFNYGPIFKNDFNTFIVKPLSKTAPSFYKFVQIADYKRIDCTGVVGVAVTLNSTSGNTVNYSGSCQVGGNLYHLGYLDMFRVYTESGVYLPSSGITYGTGGSTSINSAVVLENEYHREMELEFYTLEGTINLWPFYEWVFFGGSSGNLPTLYGSGSLTQTETLSSVDSFQKGLCPISYNTNQSLSHSYLSNTQYTFADAQWAPQRSGFVDPRLVFSLQKTHIKGIGIFPLEGKGGRASFRQITGMITSGDVNFLVDARGYGVNYTASVEYPQWDNKKLIDGGHTETDILGNGDITFHADFLSDASGAIDYVREGGNPLLNIDFGGLLYSSGSVSNPNGSDYFGVGHSGYYYNSNNPKDIYDNIGNDLFGCVESGRFIGAGFHYDIDSLSGSIYNLVNAIPFKTPAYNRMRIRWSGTRVDPIINSVAGSPFSYNCANLSGVTNSREELTPWSYWWYTRLSPKNLWDDDNNNIIDENSDFFPYEYGDMGDQIKVTLPKILGLQTLNVSSSSEKPGMFNFGESPEWGYMETIPIHQLYGDQTDNVWLTL